MRFRYETEVPLAGWGAVCPHRGGLILEPAWLVTCSSDFSHSLQGSGLKPFPSESLGGGYPYPVWVRRMGSACIQNLRGPHLGLSQTSARLEWLCLPIQMCFSLWVFRWERNQPSISASYLPPFPEDSHFFLSPLQSSIVQEVGFWLCYKSGFESQVFLFVGYVTLSNITWTCFFLCKMGKIMPVLQRRSMKMYIKGQAHIKLQGRESKSWTHQKVQDTTSSPIPGFLHKY